MAGSDYHFVSHWRVEGDIDTVSAILRDAASLPRWWPSVYLDVKVLEPGDATGRGALVSLSTKGWLPYTLRWAFRIVESDPPHRWTLVAWGDLVGRGVWTLAQRGPFVDITYDWRIRADKPLLRYGSALLRPIFAANHRWAMARGEASLKLELTRRRLAEAAAVAQGPPGSVPPPPGPTFPHNLRRRRPTRRA